VNATRVAIQSWSLCLRDPVAELITARLRWCLVCDRVGLWGWQPLCAAMPITWICADRTGCRARQACGGSRREQQVRRLMVWRRPGLTRPPTGRPWHPSRLAAPGCALHGPVAVAVEVEQPAGDPTGEPAVLVCPRRHSAAAGWAGDRR
jgi:hypothetical protein